MRENILFVVGTDRLVSWLEKNLIQDKTENKKRNYIWNTAAGILNAAEAVILSMVITRVTNLTDAGILTLAFAVANLFVTVGKFGVRSYQVTDTQCRFSFSTYVRSRFITIGIMILFSLMYCLYGGILKGFSLYKVGSIFCMCMIYAVEALEDVFWGLFQKENRIDIGAKVFIVRWSGILITYIVSMTIWKNLLVSSVLALLVSCYLSVICIRKVYKCFKQGGKIGTNIELLIECFPLCMVSFLSYYLCNAPKYVIAQYMTDEVQACFGFVAMPVFVIGLLSGFIYQPQLVSIALQVKEELYGTFSKTIKKQVLKIVFLTVICLLGTFFFGIPVLSLLYSTNLDLYKNELLLMVGGGGVLAIANYFVVILTIMRMQIKVVLSYVIVTLFTVPICQMSVKYMGTLGGATFFVFDMMLLTIILSWFVFKSICNMRNISSYNT